MSIKKYNVIACHRGSIVPAFRDITPYSKQEAEQEAERRNREDPERDEFRFAIMAASDAAKY